MGHKLPIADLTGADVRFKHSTLLQNCQWICKAAASESEVEYLDGLHERGRPLMLRIGL
jgi:hypothetical protein